MSNQSQTSTEPKDEELVPDPRGGTLAEQVERRVGELLPWGKRTCLRCGKQFRSSGPGNRICPHCIGDRAVVLEPVQEPKLRKVKSKAE